MRWEGAGELPRSIGVFDSGVGGLTVLKELILEFPQESFVYLGDTARLPYGSKSAQTIRKYSEQNIQFLLRQNVKAVVIACNTASTQYRERESYGIPIYNVIDPGAEVAWKVSESKRVGVLGTRATIQSNAYAEELLKRGPVEVFSIACPLFVPLAEEGWDGDPLTNLIVYRYLSEILNQNIDTLILGCTHYPLLKNSIRKAAGAGMFLVDSGQAIAKILKNDMEGGFLQATLESGVRGKVRIMTTDRSEHFNNLALKILEPWTPSSFEVVDL